MEMFSFMFKDNKFLQKAGLYFLFLLVSKIVSLYNSLVSGLDVATWINYIIGVFIAFVTAGYGVSCVKALIEQKNSYVLPLMNLLKNSFIGMKFYIASALFVVIMFIGFILTLISYNKVYISMFNPSESFVIGAAVTTIVLGILNLCILIFFLFYLCAYYWMFANNQSLLTFVKFKKVISLVGKDFFKYLKSVLLIMLCVVIMGIITNLFIVTLGQFIPVDNIYNKLITAVFSSIFGTYFFFVISYLVAKSISSEYIDLV